MADQGQVKTDDELDAQAEATRRLALAQIRQYPDPVLRLEAQEVQEFDGDLAQLVERMIRLMQDARGVGLAANQVGILRRVFVIQADEEQEPRALVNPAIVDRSDELDEDDEGCLSMQGVVVPVERPVRVRLEARDEQGEPGDARARGAAGAGRAARARPSRRRPDPRSHDARGQARGARGPAPVSRAVKLAVAATAPLGADVLERLAAKHDIEFLLTRPDRQRGRGRKVGAPPAKEAAVRLGIPVRQLERLDETFSLDGVDTIVVVAYGALIPLSLLDRANWLNVHPSRLPRWRGAAPIERAIMAGDEESAVSVIRARGGARRRADRRAAGPLDRRRHDGRRRLRGRSRLAPRADRRGARQRLVLAAGRRGATYAEKIAPADRELDWSRPAKELHDRIRALSPHIGARGERRGPRRDRLARRGSTATASSCSRCSRRAGPACPTTPGSAAYAPDHGLERLGARARDRAVDLRGRLLAARRAARDDR